MCGHWQSRFDADLHGRRVDRSAAGFARAMVSCHSFLRLARLAGPLMTGGGSLVDAGHQAVG